MQLYMVFHEDCRKRLVSEAWEITAGGRRIKLELDDLSKGRAFHALCIFLLIVKAWPKPLPNKISVPKRSTFIETLAAKIVSNQSWSTHVDVPLSVVRVITGSRGSPPKGQSAAPPHLRYNAKLFPPGNMIFAKSLATGKSDPVPLENANDLFDFAKKLESANGFWDEGCVHDLNAQAFPSHKKSTGESVVKLLPFEPDIGGDHSPYTGRYNETKFDSPLRQFIHMLRNSSGEVIAELIASSLIEQVPEFITCPVGLAGNTPLMMGLIHGKPDLVKYLLRVLPMENHEAVQKPNLFGDTPLLKALSLGHDQEIVSLLLTRSASLDDRNRRGADAFHAIAYSARRDAAKWIRELLIQKPDCTNQTIDGECPLAIAIERGSPDDVIQLLVSESSSLDIIDSQGESLVYKAYKARNYDLMVKIIERLQMAGLNWNHSPSLYRDRRNPPVFQAIEEGDIDAVRNLFTVLPEMRLDDRETSEHRIQRCVLQVAIKCRQVEILYYLLSIGVSPFNPDLNGLLPREVLPSADNCTAIDKTMQNMLFAAEDQRNELEYSSHYPFAHYRY